MKALKPLTALSVSIFAFVGPIYAGAVREHPSPGTSLVRFAQVDTDVYKGSKPKTDADFAFLQSKHILNVRFLPFLAHAEQKKAKEYGIVYLYGLMNASTFAPSEKHVDHILEILHDQCHQPIYFHCDIGRDRTSLIATLYQEYFGGLAPQDAWQQMKDFGFKDSWTLVGLKHYLLKHPTAPASLLASSSQTCSGQ